MVLVVGTQFYHVVVESQEMKQFIWLFVRIESTVQIVLVGGVVTVAELPLGLQDVYN